MRSPREIASEGLLLSRSGRKRIKSYRHVVRLIEAGYLKADRKPNNYFKISDLQIEQYNKSIRKFHKTLDL